MADTRSKVLVLMRAAIRKKQSRTSFLRDMKTQGLTYPQKIMVADWLSISEFVAKDGVLRHVRRDAYPRAKSIVTTDWAISGEYMYKVKVTSRLRPDEPITERFVNIVSDSPMTPRMVEQAVVTKWAEWEDYTAETLEEVTPWTAIRTTI